MACFCWRRAQNTTPAASYAASLRAAAIGPRGPLVRADVLVLLVVAPSLAAAAVVVVALVVGGLLRGVAPLGIA